jgi:hypothetical protein
VLRLLWENYSQNLKQTPWASLVVIIWNTRFSRYVVQTFTICHMECCFFKLVQIPCDFVRSKRNRDWIIIISTDSGNCSTVFKDTFTISVTDLWYAPNLTFQRYVHNYLHIYCSFCRWYEKHVPFFIYRFTYVCVHSYTVLIASTESETCNSIEQSPLSL